MEDCLNQLIFALQMERVELKAVDGSGCYYRLSAFLDVSAERTKVGTCTDKLFKLKVVRSQHGYLSLSGIYDLSTSTSTGCALAATYAVR